MEWWILAGLMLMLGLIGIANRVRRRRRTPVEQDRKTIYPLW